MTGPLPRSPAELTPEWLTTALRGAGLKGRVSDVRIADPVAGVAVTSRVARLLLTVEDDDDFPTSLVAKVANPSWHHGLDLQIREDRFYREISAGLPVPRCWFSRVDPDSRTFVLLLEDLTEAVPGHRLEGWSEDEAALAVDALADVHRRWWESPRLKRWPEKTYNEADIARSLHQFATFWPRLVAAGRYAVSDELAAAAARLPLRYADDLRRLSRGPKTLIHADIHAENVILDRREEPPRLVLLDWQNAAAGHPAFDLAGVLCVATSPEAQRSSAHDLLLRYHARLDRDIELEDLIAATRSAARRIFAGVTRWLVLFEEEELRDARTVQGHWRCLSEGLLVWDD